MTRSAKSKLEREVGDEPRKPKNRGRDSYLVLRTVYLWADQDERLRQIAYEERRSKNEIIREAVDTLLLLTEYKKQKKN